MLLVSMRKSFGDKNQDVSGLKSGTGILPFFHKQVDAMNHYKIVQEIHSQDQVVIEFEKIKEEASRHFSAIYFADPVTNPPNLTLLDLVPRLVNRKDNKNLTQRITLEELNSEVEDMEEDKALGPDRFSARFIKVCWETIHKDLHNMVFKS